MTIMDMVSGEVYLQKEWSGERAHPHQFNTIESKEQKGADSLIKCDYIERLRIFNK